VGVGAVVVVVMIVDDNDAWALPQRTVSGIDCWFISRSQINAWNSLHGLLSQPSWVRKIHFPSSIENLHGHHEWTLKKVFLFIKNFLFNYHSISLFHQISKTTFVVVHYLLRENVLIFFPEEYYVNELNVNQLINIFHEHKTMFVFDGRFLYILLQVDIHHYYIADNLNTKKWFFKWRFECLISIPWIRIQNPDWLNVSSVENVRRSEFFSLNNEAPNGSVPDKDKDLAADK
jgi:hypothetical protein